MLFFYVLWGIQSWFLIVSFGYFVWIFKANIFSGKITLLQWLVIIYLFWSFIFSFSHLLSLRLFIWVQFLPLCLFLLLF